MAEQADHILRKRCDQVADQLGKRSGCQIAKAAFAGPRLSGLCMAAHRPPARLDAEPCARIDKAVHLFTRQFVCLVYMETVA